MLFEYKYRGQSEVNHSGAGSKMSFVPDAGRKPTWFQGVVNEHVPFREAISALHAVVTSDMRYHPRDMDAYKAWLVSQEDGWVADLMAEQAQDKLRIHELKEKLHLVNDKRRKILAPYYEAQQKYFNHLYKVNKDWWFVLDPVITVHPDQIFFECFSQDESSYGRLSCQHDMFDQLGDFSCGTTNIDYSSALYDEFQKIRGYKKTELSIDPEGFTVETGKDEAYREVKIDLPDSWVRGFLQVSSAMTMGGAELELHPMDLHNILFALKRRKEKVGPRSLRFHLKVGQPLRVEVDPWGEMIDCPRSLYKGSRDEVVRIWGRRRLMILERMIPLAKKVHVRLLGYGMPSFWRVDMGPMQFTLGLSGWSANDWSQAANFDLLAPRGEASSDDVARVISGLENDWFSTTADLGGKLGMDSATCLAALGIATQNGRVIYDDASDVWRLRELSRDPLPTAKLAFSSERERDAATLIAAKQEEPKITVEDDGRVIRGKIKGGGKLFEPVLFIDKDERLTNATCDCNFFSQNHLRQGPCEHMLALRAIEKRSSAGRK